MALRCRGRCCWALALEDVPLDVADVLNEPLEVNLDTGLELGSPNPDVEGHQLDCMPSPPKVHFNRNDLVDYLVNKAAAAGPLALEDVPLDVADVLNEPLEVNLDTCLELDSPNPDVEGHQLDCMPSPPKVHLNRNDLVDHLINKAQKRGQGLHI